MKVKRPDSCSPPIKLQNFLHFSTDGHSVKPLILPTQPYYTPNFDFHEVFACPHPNPYLKYNFFGSLVWQFHVCLIFSFYENAKTNVGKTSVWFSFCSNKPLLLAQNKTK